MSRKQYDYETVWLCTTTQGSVLRHSKDDNGEDACRGNGFISIVEYCMVTVIAVSRTISVCSCVLQQRTTKMCDRNTRKPRKFKQTNGRLRSFRGVLGPGSDMSEERMTTLLSQLFIFFFTIFGVCFQGRFNTHQIVFSSEYEAPTWRYSFENVRPQHKHTQVQQHLHDETKNKEISP